MTRAELLRDNRDKQLTIDGLERVRVHLEKSLTDANERNGKLAAEICFLRTQIRKGGE